MGARGGRTDGGGGIKQHSLKEKKIFHGYQVLVPSLPIALHGPALQSSMDGFRAGQAERLKQLSLSSNECMEVLKKKLGTAGRGA